MGRLSAISILIGVAAGTCSCATPAPQTEAFLKAPRSIPESHLIENVTFIEQSESTCGPASLAMALTHAGHPVSLLEMTPQVFTPGQEGTLQSDMISATRRNGMLAVPIYGIDPLLKEIAAGHPVVVLENLALKWYPRWHYAVAIGYDLKEEDIILHDGHRAARHWGLRKFERSWELANYWGMVVLPPNELSTTADELTHAGAAAGLEQAGKLSEAEIAYHTVLSRWPDSLGALIGLGNVHYARREFGESARYLAVAAKAHPESAVVWHNLAIAQGAAHRVQEAKRSAKHALALAGADASAYEKSLRDWL